MEATLPCRQHQGLEAWHCAVHCTLQTQARWPGVRRALALDQRSQALHQPSTLRSPHLNFGLDPGLESISVQAGCCGGSCGRRQGRRRRLRSDCSASSGWTGGLLARQDTCRLPQAGSARLRGQSAGRAGVSGRGSLAPCRQCLHSGRALEPWTAASGRDNIPNMPPTGDQQSREQGGGEGLAGAVCKGACGGAILASLRLSRCCSHHEC